MACADKGEQGPGEDQEMPEDGQLAVPDGQEVPGGDQEMLQDGQLAVPDGPLAGHDGQLAVPDGQLAVQMPDSLTIGTKKAFGKNYPSRT